MRFPAAAGAELFNPSHIVTCDYWRHVPAMYCHGAGWRPIIARATSGSTKTMLLSERHHPARERLFNVRGEPAGRIIEALGQNLLGHQHAGSNDVLFWLCSNLSPPIVASRGIFLSHVEHQTEHFCSFLLYHC